jgi:hypothetical protein
VGDTPTLAYALWLLGRLTAHDDYPTGWAILEKSLAHFRALDDQRP